MGLGEQTVFHSVKKDCAHVGYSLFGGYPESERVIVRFGNPNSLGYEKDFPISCLKITPSNARFSGEMSHRDCLGAVMNLGIDRELVGDILVQRDQILLFCQEKISDYIKENLTKIRHTSVVLEEYSGLIGEIVLDTKELEIQLNSLRLDALVSKVFKLSREEGLGFFREEKVFVNGNIMTGNAHKPKDSDIISVRGMGRFKYNGEKRTTKKGKLVVSVDLYV